MMHLPVYAWQFFSVSLSTVLVTAFAVGFGWPLFVTMALLVGAPVYLMMRETGLQIVRLALYAALLAILVLVLESAAHAGGAWYTVTSSAWRWYGVSLETVAAGLVLTFFLLALYEYAFDDRRTERVVPVKMIRYAAVLAVVVGFVLYAFFLAATSFAFFWVVALLSLLLVGLLLLAYRGDVFVVFQKALWFGLLAWPILFCIDAFFIVTDVRIFAFATEYLHMVSLMGQQIPIEELLLLYFWPVATVVLYELFLDDRS